MYSMTCTPAGIATFNSTTHTVSTVAGAEGVVTVTAKWPGTDGYCDKYASYNIVVGDGCAKIGTGEVSSSSGTYGGVFSYYNSYGYTQQVYTANEILAAGGCVGPIRSIALHYAESESSALPFEIYLGMTSQGSVPTSWINDANLTRVFNGTVTFTAANNGWNSIDISSADWEWDGVSNIVVAIRRTSSTSGTVSYPDFYYTSSTGMVAYCYNSSSSISLDGNNVATVTGTSTTQRPEIKFCIECCTRPNFSFNEATVYCEQGGTCAGQTIGVNQSGGAVTYSSSNTYVASVNATTGAITVNHAGTTVITATVEETGGFCSRSASYTLIVPCGTESHTLTYNTQANCNGGTASPATWTYTGTTATVTNVTPTCSSASSFVGWYENANGSGTRYTPGQNIDLTCGNVTLYAVYSYAPDTVEGAGDCEDAQAFCASNDEHNGVILTAVTGVESPSGMCSYFDNPSWWYIQISQAGRLEMTISSTAGDVDFGCWGPFDNFTCSPTDLTDNAATETWYTSSSPSAWGISGATSNTPSASSSPICDVSALAYPCGNLVDFSASTASVEYLQIDNAQVGEYYIVVVANWADDEGIISFTQTNLDAANHGMADCEIVTNCDINVITANTTACNTTNNTFTVSGDIHFTDQPSDGTLTITDVTANPPVSQVFYPPFTSPTPYTLTVPSDGVIHNLEATFASSTTNCTKVSTYRAPDACMDCSSSVEHTDVTCHGLNDGTITLTSTNGRGARSYYIGRNGSTPTLTATTNNTSYTWDGLQPGTYTVIVKDTTNCESEQTVVISDQTEVTVTITTPTTGGCPSANGQNYAITATPGGGVGSYQNYTWSVVVDGTPGTISGTGSNANIASDGHCHEYVISLMLTDGNGCPATANKTFATVDNTKPVIATTATNNQDWGCDPANVVAPTFTATDNCPTAGTSLTPTVTAGDIQSNGCARSRTWTANVTDNCNNAATPATITYTWTESQNPTIGAIANQNATMGNSGCKYKMIDLSTVTLAAASDPCGGTVEFVSQSVAAGTEYTQTNAQQTIPVTVTVSGTCGKQATATVNVIIPAKDITVDITNTGASVCAGGDTLLTATGSSCNGALTYAWTPTTGLNPTTGASVTATVSTETTYTVTATDPAGCTATDQITVTINPEVTLNVSNQTQTKCLGAAITDIDITVTNGTISNAAALQTALAAIGLTYNNGHISGTPNAFGTHTFEVVAVSNQTPQCSQQTETITLNITNLITPVISGNEDICVTASEQNTQLTLTETAGDNSFTYTWNVDGGTIVSGQGTNSIVAEWIGDGDKTVTVTLSLDGCSAEGTKTIHVRPAPVATITPVTGDVCPNAGTIDITGNTTTTNPNYTYNWGGGLTLDHNTVTVAATSDVVTATIPSNNCNITYQVTLNVVDNYGCKNTATPITITVKDDQAPVASTYTLPDKDVDGCNYSQLATLYPAVTTVAALEAEATALGGPLTISDNCTTDKTQLTLSNTETYTGRCPIVVTRKYKVTDLCGKVSNEIVQTIRINVADAIDIAPATNASGVECVSEARADLITPPTVTDACGTTLLPLDGSPVVNNQVTNCNGTITYTYNYKDCAEHPAQWVYTYTVTHPNLTVPADSVSPIPCLSDTSNTFIPVALTDACGNTVTATLVGTPDMSGYNASTNTGDVVFNYQYTDCAGQTYPWTLTYEIVPSAFTETPSGASTVSCISQATLQEPMPRTVCGEPIVYVPDANNPIDVPADIDANGGCGTRTYRYTYNVNGTDYEWNYVYTIRPDSIVFEGTVATRDTVECDDPSFTPTLPTVKTNCGIDITSSATVVTGGTYDGCEGTKTWTYTFSDCTGRTRNWTFTRLIRRVTPPAQEGNVEDAQTVECLASTRVAPTVLPEVKDVCGNTLPAPQPVIDSTWNGCTGEKTYTYTYEDCVGLTYVWHYTYNIVRTGGIHEEGTAPTETVVHCINDTVRPTVMPVMKDTCGNILQPLNPMPAATVVLTGCVGTVTFTYNYEDCAGQTYEWSYVNRIERSEKPHIVTAGGIPRSVICEGYAVADSITLPVIADQCGVTLDAPVPVITNDWNTEPCNGTRTFTYNYTDCADSVLTWTYTFTIDMPAPTIPANGGTTVQCYAEAQVVPTTPEVTDTCGRTLTVAAGTVDDAVVSGIGTVTYNFTYTDCEGNDWPWQYVYTVTPDPVPYPADEEINVYCAADALVAPTTPAITVCMAPVVFTLQGTTGDVTSGCGDYEYAYSYTLNNVDTVWRYTYHVRPGDFEVPAPGETQLQCYNGEIPTPPAVSNDSTCGNVSISAPVVDDSDYQVNGCTGDIVFTYTYSNCAHSHDWTYTYHIVRTTVPVANDVPTSSNVTCVDLADGTFTMPTVTDACGVEIANYSNEEITGNPVSCNGTKIYTYTYTDCAGLTMDWVYTYNINDTVRPMIETIPVDELPTAVPVGNCQYGIPNFETVVMNYATETCSTPIWGGQTPAAGEVYSAQAIATTVPVVVTVRDECNNARTLTINVTIPANSLQLPIIQGVSICEGESATLTASPTTNAAAMPINCVWTLGSTTIGQGEAPLSVEVMPTTNTTYSVEVTDQAGCTTSRNVLVSVNHPTHTAFTQVVCEGYTWSNNGWSETYTTSGNYTHTYNTAQGCPSTDTLHLTVNYNTNTEYTESACDVFMWNNHGWNQTYTSSGNYTHSYTTAEGCPSTDTLHLTINHNSSATYIHTECDSYTWTNNDPGWSQTYTTSGTYSHDYTSAEGCPSTDVLTLTVNYSHPSSVSATECDHYTWYGTSYTTSGEYTHMLQTTRGCDSLVTLYLTIINSYETTIYDTVCEGTVYSWYGNDYTTPGVYDHTLTSVDGCDSVLTLRLSNFPTVRVTISETHSCKTGSYILSAAAVNADTFIWSSDPEDEFMEGDGLAVETRPLTPTTYTVVAGMANHMECAKSDTIVLLPIKSPIAAIEAHPNYLTIDRLDWSASDRSSYADWIQWYVDGEYYSADRHINGIAEAGIDSLSLMLIAGTAECADTALLAIPYSNVGLWIPNAFTPNMDYNNFFGPEGVGITEFEMWVYNREGLLVFHSETIGDRWDGKHNGTKCPQGSYTYRILYRTVNDEESLLTKVGTVLLLR